MYYYAGLSTQRHLAPGRQSNHYVFVMVNNEMFRSENKTPGRHTTKHLKSAFWLHKPRLSCSQHRFVNNVIQIMERSTANTCLPTK